MKASIKKNIFISAILLAMLAVFTCGFLSFVKFGKSKKATAAVEGVSNVVLNGNWQASTTEADTYTIDIPASWIADSYSMTFTATGVGPLSKLYLQVINSAGSLTVQNAANGAKSSYSGNVSSYTDLFVDLVEGDNNFTITCSSKSLKASNGTAQVKINRIDAVEEGISYGDVVIEDGWGVSGYPFLIKNPEDFEIVRAYPDRVYQLANNITFEEGSTFAPIGTSAKPFTGTFDGANFTIYNINVTDQIYAGMFSYASGATIKDLKLENINVYGHNYLSFLVASASNKTKLQNVHINGRLEGYWNASDGDKDHGSRMGGLVGYGHAVDCVIATDCSVSGEVIQSKTTYTSFRIGGLTGACGTFTNCIMNADVYGSICVGGLVGGGYVGTGDSISDAALKFTKSAIFNDCQMAGRVIEYDFHSCNYPYIGYINGYGAWVTIENNNTGVLLDVDYTSTKGVKEIGIFNSDNSVDDVTKGIVVTPTATENQNEYNFTKFVSITTTCIGTNTSAMLDETSVVGISSNFGGFVIRFTMDDGTYKYVSTLDQKTPIYNSKLSVNLDELTSYVDNFNNISINTSFGTTGGYKTADDDSSISLFGSAKISNANDLEHLTWLVNGGIPTYFEQGKYFYNARSITTLGVYLEDNIDLTTPRYARVTDGVALLITEEEFAIDSTNAYILNNNSAGEMLYQYYGFGISEMWPYRGSIEGNNHNIHVEINCPDSYMSGIIKCVTNDKNTIYVQNLSVSGRIIGGYMAGIVCMVDNHERENSLYFTNVINNSNVNAKYLAAGILAQPHSQPKVTFENCVNNGNIYASNGDLYNGKAGGICGDAYHYSIASTVSNITFKSCVNNGKVGAKASIAAGFIVRAAAVFVDGENVNRGVVYSGSSNNALKSFFVGSYLTFTSYNPSSKELTDAKYTITNPGYNGYFKLIHQVNIGTVTEYSYTVTDKNGNVLATSAEGLATTEDDTTISVEIRDISYADFLTSSINFKNRFVASGMPHTPVVDLYSGYDTLYQTISVPINVEMASGNVYTSNISPEELYDNWTQNYSLNVNAGNNYFGTSSGQYGISTTAEQTTSTRSNWTLRANVYFSNGADSIRINLTPNVNTATNQLVWVKATFVDSNGIYAIPDSLAQNLYRISENLENFHYYSKTLLKATDKTNDWFKTQGEKVYSKYTEIVTDLQAYDSQDGYNGENMQRFWWYLGDSRVNLWSYVVTEEKLNAYFNNIVSSADLSNLQNVSVDYGKYEFTKNLTFTMLNGTTQERSITYTFSKNGTLSATATASSAVTFSVGEVTTYSYSSDVGVTINPIDLIGVTFDNAEVVYDGTAKTITAELTLLNNEDIVEFTLAYNGEESAVSAGTYSVTIASIFGTDSIFYTIPENYTAGSLKISPIILSLNVEDGKEYEYNKGQQATAFEVSVLSETDYEFSQADWSVVYQGESYNDSEAPVNVGNYTATIQVNSNFTFSGNGYFTFKIKPKQITNVSITEEFTYSFSAPNLGFSNFEGLIGGDEIAVDSYTIFDSTGAESTAVNYGNYTIQINSLSNPNYQISEQAKIKSFVVNKADVEITILNRSSTYGETINLENLGYNIDSGEVFEGDSLMLSAVALPSTFVGEYPLTANLGNNNYNAVINAGKYTISPRALTIDYGTTWFTYSSQDLYEDIISPSIDNLADGDAVNFTFSLYSGDDIVTSFKNAGNYTLKLNENEVTANYTISLKQQDYIISQYGLALKAKNLAKRYNQPLQVSDLSLDSYVLAGQDSLGDIASISYTVLLNGEEVDYLDNLDVGTYVIKLNLTPNTTENSLYSNYLITLTDGTLTISEESTYLVASQLEANADKFYDGEVVDYTAILYGADDEVISEAQITYEITKDGETATEIKSVGTYTIVITATAGDNYQESTITYNVVIKTNVITITLDSDSQTYNGQSFIPTYQKVMNKDVNLTGILTVSLLDSNDNVAIDAINAGSYSLNFAVNDSGYQLQKSKFAFRINQINISAEVVSRTETYGEDIDIQASTINITQGKVLEGETLMLVYSAEGYTGDANDYVLTATSQNPNYNASITSGTLSVAKRELTVTYTGYAQLTYNPNGYEELISASVSNALSENVYSVKYLNSVGQQASVVDAGDYSLVVEIIDTVNYKFADSEEVKFTTLIKIDVKELDLTIVVENKIYDGLALEVSDVTANNASISTDLYTIEWSNEAGKVNSAVGAGTYTVEIKETDAQNYKFNNSSKQLTIQKRVLTIADINSEYEYNRQAIKPQLSLENTASNTDVKLSYSYQDNGSGFKTVDTYTIVINGLTGVDKDNYVLNAGETITYSIVKARVQVNIANPSVTFTNNQVKQEELGITFAGNLSILESDYSISSLPTNAGTYQIDFITNNANIDFGITSFQFVVEKAEITEIEFKGSVVDFDNKAHSITINNLTLSNGIVLSVSYSGNGVVNAGNHTIKATLSNDNYNTKVLEATLTINKVSVNVPLIQSNYVYNKLGQGYEIKNLTNLWYGDIISYNYSGENYLSNEKPINAGTYSLNISSNNENNLVVANSNNQFKIATKGLTITSLSTQTHTYNAQPIAFIPAISGAVGTDSVGVKIKYNGETSIPVNAGEYEISFIAIEGDNASNYHIENKDATAILSISPYSVRVVADAKSVTYGEAEAELTYTHENLLGNDTLSGTISREPGLDVGSYKILQNTLTAGENYTINFVTAFYDITQRVITHGQFATSFVYNGENQIPEIEFFNIVSGENVGDVVEVRTYGDTLNAGNYQLSIAVINQNYKIEGTNYFTIVISKLDQSDKILSLASSNKDYDGKTYEPIVLLNGELNYILTYSLGDAPINGILNAGEYKVKVTIDEQNFKGSKEFTFTVNKILYPYSAIQNANVLVSANSLEVVGLSNINVGVSSNDFIASTKLQGLTDKTTYEVFVKLLESTNYKATVFSLGQFTTTPCTIKINQQIESLDDEEVNVANLDDIKSLLKDAENVSELDIDNLNLDKLNEIKAKYEEYFDNLIAEIKNVKNASSIITFGAEDTIVLASSITSVIGLGLISTRGKRKYGKRK